MSSINIDQVASQILAGIKSLAETTLKDYEAQAKTDGKELVDNTKADLQQWATELETGAITRDDLNFLLQEDVDLGKMNALKQAGLAQVRVDQFRNSVINLIIGTITGLIKI